MSVNGYRRPSGLFSNKKHAIRQDIVEDHPRKLLTKVYAQKMARINNKAIEVDHKKVLYFQRLQTGRKCSCFEISSTPDSECTQCYGTGIISGYSKFGTISEMVESTYCNLNLVNVDIDYDFRPNIFRLKETSLKGFIEFKIDVRNNSGKLDLFQIAGFTKSGALINGFIRTQAESSYTPISVTAIEERLTENFLYFKIELVRNGFNTKEPILSHFILRYKLLNDLYVKVDVPRETESLILSEFGISESFTQITVYWDNTIRRISTEDFFFMMETGKSYKIIESQPFISGGVLIATDSTARYVFEYEPYKNFPI